MGAKIINMSLGVSSTSAIDAAIQYAYNNNVLLVASTGKTGSEGVSYPASNNNVMAVGATDMNNLWCNFSNYGSKMSVCAPGYNIITTTLNNSYASEYGTSVAAPHVSGVASLMLSVNPNLTTNQVRTIIEQTAQRIHPETYSYSNNPSVHPNGDWNKYVGYGIVDAHKAVMEAYFYNHAIEGDYNISSCNEYTYSLSSTIPNGTSLTWEISNNMEIVSGQGTSNIVVRPIGNGGG